ncbi:retrotransposon protein, putative, ty1-copia subclass [Tanacetum coccineum]
MKWFENCSKCFAKGSRRNQLGKDIKSYGSGQWGRVYVSEFLDHLEGDHGIIAIYSSLHSTNQWCVAERRKQNPTDMVRSRMSQTNLYYVLWDMQSGDACNAILNMVPTKKVEKTPYEKTLVASGSLRKKTDMDGACDTTYKARSSWRRAEILNPRIDWMSQNCLLLNGYLIMKRFNKRRSTVKVLSSEIFQNECSTPDELKLMQNVPYASAVGSIMYDVRFLSKDIEAEYIAAFDASLCEAVEALEIHYLGWVLFHN